MSFETIQFERRDGVAVLTLNRPERVNAMDRAMLSEINLAMDDVETDAGIKALVVRGAGKNFSSGFNLKEQIEKPFSGVKEWKRILDQDYEAVMRFWFCTKPTIAAIQGYCLAGAFELAMACDLAIAEEDALFGEPELKFGAGIVVMLLPWMVGPKIAKEIILRGLDHITSEEAARLGLVNRVVPSGTAFEKAFAWARDIAVVDPMLMQETKRAINRTYEIMGLVQALESALEIDLRIEGEGSSDKIQFLNIARQKGLRAALAWRDARFTSGESGRG
ncbi:MAG: enoyl-CoA hydratase/isomerase family protein [Bradyrhizobiaceae bacterium]|nr:MAG: enoyl-CoA hydratase/isomerase family protein [Bradyrhizobiaceae bacterium]